LNPTGVYVWKLLDGKHTIDALLQKVCAHADDVPEDLRDHVGAFVDALVAEGLAGFERTACGQEKYFSFPPAEVSATEPFTYAPPQLVNLNQEQAACGANCTTGSQATNTCSTGNLACSCSSGTGRSPACCTGACDGVSCCSGDCDSMFCTNGGCTTYCGTGSSVSICNGGSTPTGGQCWSGGTGG
jgi:hypothetical protein